MWLSVDRGANWVQLKNGLPDVPVLDIQIHPRTRELILGTHGRSVYIMNVAPLEQLTSEVMATGLHLFNPVPVTTFNFLEHRDFLGQGTYVGANPPGGAVLDYYFAEEVKEAKLRISDLEGALIRELPAEGAQGLHRLVWDLRLAPPPQPPRPRPTEGVDPADPRPAESTLARVPGDYGGGGDPTGGEAGAPPDPQRGPVVLPGEYVVKLVAGGAESSATLTRRRRPARRRERRRPAREVDALEGGVRRTEHVDTGSQPRARPPRRRRRDRQGTGRGEGRAG